LVATFERGSVLNFVLSILTLVAAGLPQKSRTAKERKTRPKGGLLSTNQPALEN
jgi:hypothetical protein